MSSKPLATFIILPLKRMQNDYQEINLVDWVKVILIRKKLIGIITLLTIVLAGGGALALTPPPLYETKGVIAIGKVNGELLDSVDQTRAFILTDKNGKYIAEQSARDQNAPISKNEITSIVERITIDGTAPNGNEEKQVPLNNILNVSFHDQDAKGSVAVVELTQKLILERHKTLYEAKKKIQDTLLAQKEKNLKETQDQLQRVEQKLDTLFGLRYPSSYAIMQGETTTSYVATKNDLLQKIQTLESDILLRKITEESDSTSEVISLSPPPLPDTPIQKGVRISVIMIAGLILGVFMGILAAFIAEWWRAVKLKISA